jgi:FkbM family methyltransferase
MNWKRAIKKAFNTAGLEIRRHRPDPMAVELDSLLTLRGRSTSQLKQDMFVLSELGFKRKGYFVEFGATNGVNLSNSYLLEKELDWDGILAEPATSWHDELRRNRRVHIETCCVWSESGSSLKFNQAADSSLSTIDAFTDSDLHATMRKNGQVYEVKTISLVDMLDKYSAPSVIDYLSIDTEGSEYDILRTFDFEKYRFRVITCEHNHTAKRDKVFALLNSKGYRRKYEHLSGVDDWYVAE